MRRFLSSVGRGIGKGARGLGRAIKIIAGGISQGAIACGKATKPLASYKLIIATIVLFAAYIILSIYGASAGNRILLAISGAAMSLYVFGIYLAVTRNPN